MDPSGIIGIIGVAGQILATCTKLGLNWRDAPDDAKKSKSEIDGLHKTLWETYNHLIQNPDFITAFEGKHSSVLSSLAAPSNSDDSALLFTCKEELEDVLKSLQKRLGGSRFGWERLKATFSNEKTQSAIENVQRRCQDINSKILIDNTAIAVNTNLEVRSTRRHLEERHLDENKKEILDWITPIDFAAQQVDNLERRQDGTGQWLLESAEFQTWIEEDRKTLFYEFRADEGYRDQLLKTVLGLSKSANVNIFATSRHIPEIESHFEDAPSVEIRATDEDVTKFLDGHMYKLPQAVRKSKELQGEIKHSIVQAVQGMFLLAQLHLDSLQGKRSVKAIKDALRKLATGSSAYDSAYEEAMERIEGQLDEQKTLAKDALSWIVCARRPLETLELQHALAVERGTAELDRDNITELEDIVSVCAGLIAIDEESGIIRLVHYTTQEYFERTAERKWNRSKRHEFRASKNNALTLQADVNIKDCWKLTPLSYAVIGGRVNFIEWLLSKGEIEVDSEYFEDPYPPTAIAATIGEVARILPFIESDKANLDAQNKLQWTPLMLAANGGHADIADASLSTESKGWRWSRGRDGGTPLEMALKYFGRDHPITKLLVDRMEVIGISTEATIEAWDDVQGFPYVSVDDIDDTMWFHKD
ncbi:hypothetical protein N0V92_012088 [Colletotrichum tropicale]|nr:hypothetical protein N0V92_012088 [Colletotrichum tropicale]